MFQRVQIIGRIGQDPEMRYTPEGIPVTNFSVATTETISKAASGGGERPCPQGWKESYNGKNWEVTTWFRVTAWRRLAEVMNEYGSKGRQVFVEGTLSGDVENGALNPRVWTGQDGQARASFELTARSVKFLGSSGNGGGAPVGEAPPEGLEEDPLPF